MESGQLMRERRGRNEGGLVEEGVGVGQAWAETRRSAKLAMYTRAPVTSSSRDQHKARRGAREQRHTSPSKASDSDRASIPKTTPQAHQQPEGRPNNGHQSFMHGNKDTATSASAQQRLLDIMTLIAMEDATRLPLRTPEMAATKATRSMVRTGRNQEPDVSQSLIDNSPRSDPSHAFDQGEVGTDFNAVEAAHDHDKVEVTASANEDNKKVEGKQDLRRVAEKTSKHGSPLRQDAWREQTSVSATAPLTSPQPAAVANRKTRKGQPPQTVVSSPTHSHAPASPRASSRARRLRVTAQIAPAERISLMQHDKHSQTHSRPDHRHTNRPVTTPETAPHKQRDVHKTAVRQQRAQHSAAVRGRAAKSRVQDSVPQASEDKEVRIDPQAQAEREETYLNAFTHNLHCRYLCAKMERTLHLQHKAGRYAIDVEASDLDALAKDVIALLERREALKSLRMAKTIAAPVQEALHAVNSKPEFLNAYMAVIGLLEDIGNRLIVRGIAKDESLGDIYVLMCDCIPALQALQRVWHENKAITDLATLYADLISEMEQGQACTSTAASVIAETCRRLTHVAALYFQQLSATAAS